MLGTKSVFLVFSAHLPRQRLLEIMLQDVSFLASLCMGSDMVAKLVVFLDQKAVNRFAIGLYFEGNSITLIQ